MQLKKFEPTQKKFQKAFIEFPFKLYKNTPQWVPPLRMDQKDIFSIEKHAFYKHGEACFLMIVDDKKEVIGRMSVMVNNRYNDHFQSKAAFFYLFECVNDYSVAEKLFQAAIDWAKSKGLKSLIGPKGFTVFDGFGTLVKGFEFQAAFGQIYNPPYYQKFIERIGFIKIWDTHSGYLPSNIKFNEKIFRAAEIIKRKKGFHVKNFKTKSELQDSVNEIQMLYNASLADDARNMPISGDEMKTMVNQLLKFANPNLIKLIYKDEKPAGFLLAFPDISNALKRTKGHLLPFGWISIVNELKKTPCVDLSAIGILPEFQGLGATSLLYAEAYKSITSNPYLKYGEFLQLRDNNPKMLLEWEAMGVEMRKLHRLYKLDIE